MQEIVKMLEKTFGVKPRIDGSQVKVNVTKIDSWNALDLEKMKNIVSDFEIKRSGTGLLIIATPVNND